MGPKGPELAFPKSHLLRCVPQLYFEFIILLHVHWHTSVVLQRPLPRVSFAERQRPSPSPKRYHMLAPCSTGEACISKTSTLADREPEKVTQELPRSRVGPQLPRASWNQRASSAYLTFKHMSKLRGEESPYAARDTPPYKKQHVQHEVETRALSSLPSPSHLLHLPLGRMPSEGGRRTWHPILQPSRYRAPGQNS